jgi:murein DD-endopeptidase MepM/ murein hydrolase activator NlpD
MLFSSEDLSDAIRKLDAMEEISKYDTKLLDSMDEIEKEVKAAKDKIAEAKSKQEQLKNKLNNKLAELEAKKKERQRIIDGLKADIEEYKKEYDKAERAQQELKRQLANLLSYAASGSKKASAGGFIWPAPSCRGISSQYGYRTHPILGTKLFHSGIDIPAQYGDRVIASKDGKVVFSGTNGGYGNCIILDHGNGQATLYGHMSARLVSVGQKVIKGQQIGRVGSTGRSTGAHLHFEIMINGKHTNPLNYL